MKKLLIIIMFTFIVLPNLSLAQNTGGTALDYSGLVKCDGVLNPNESGRQVKCNFYNLIVIINQLVNWAFTLSLPVVAGMFAYAGYLHITGSEENIKRSRKMMQNAIIGFIIALTAWFVVTTLVEWIKDPTFTGVDTLSNLK
jgi:hypothetical protein